LGPLYNNTRLWYFLFKPSKKEEVKMTAKYRKWLGTKNKKKGTVLLPRRRIAKRNQGCSKGMSNEDYWPWR